MSSLEIFLRLVATLGLAMHVGDSTLHNKDSAAAILLGAICASAAVAAIWVH